MCVECSGTRDFRKSSSLQRRLPRTPGRLLIAQVPSWHGAVKQRMRSFHSHHEVLALARAAKAMPRREPHRGGRRPEIRTALFRHLTLVHQDMVGTSRSNDLHGRKTRLTADCRFRGK